MNETKKNKLELKYPIRKGGSNIKDTKEIVDEYKCHNCVKCRKISVREFMIYGSKYNLQYIRSSIFKDSD